MRLEIFNRISPVSEVGRKEVPMNNKAAWNMLKRKLLNVWLPTAVIMLVLVCTVR